MKKEKITVDLDNHGNIIKRYEKTEYVTKEDGNKINNICLLITLAMSIGVAFGAGLVILGGVL